MLRKKNMRESRDLQQRVTDLESVVREMGIAISYLKNQQRHTNHVQMEQQAILAPIQKDWLEHNRLIRMER